MRVGLIDTMDKALSGRRPNLSIASLAGYLIEKGHQVEVLDLFFSDDSAQHRFFQKEWGLIGITATSFAFPVCRQIGKSIKQFAPGSPPIVVGGPHVSVARQDVLSESWVDFAVYGEGEIPLLALVHLIEKHGHTDPKQLRKIDGLIFRDGDEVLTNPPQARIKDIDSLPLPPYDLFPMESYESHSLVTSRGCPFACAYCASAAIFGRNWIAKTPQRIIEEIEDLIAKWGKKPFHIVDDTFNLKTERVKEFCRLLIDKEINIQWGALGIRADKTDTRMLRLMKESGCHSVGVGIESANPQVLKNVGKGETIEQIVEGVKRIRKAQIKVGASFMIGNPGDTPKTITQSITLAKSLGLNSFRFYMAVPFPNTKLWDFVEQHGQFLRKDYENFHDYSEEPLFETDVFSFQERIEAYKAAKKAMLPSRLSVALRLLTQTFSVFRRVRREQGLMSAVKQVTSRAVRRLRAACRLKESGQSDSADQVKTRFSR